MSDIRIRILTKRGPDRRSSNHSRRDTVCARRAYFMGNGCVLRISGRYLVAIDRKIDTATKWMLMVVESHHGNRWTVVRLAKPNRPLSRVERYHRPRP